MASRDGLEGVRGFQSSPTAWAPFANEFEDGSIEWGFLCLGADRFSFIMVADAHDAVALRTSDVTGGVDVGENNYAQRVVWRRPGCTPSSAGFADLASSRSAPGGTTAPMRAWSGALGDERAGKGRFRRLFRRSLYRARQTTRSLLLTKR